MVTFYEIKVEDGVLTALAVKDTNGKSERIEAKTDGSYHSSKDGEIIRATWGLVWQAKQNKGKYPEKLTIAWG